jgi:flavin-dependent dehydrogenase
VRRSGGNWHTLLDSLMAECPHVAERLGNATPLLERPVTVAGLPYGHLHAPTAQDPPGLFRLGDQAAVIGSLTGDGVAIALASASLAAGTWLRCGNDAATYHRRLAERLSRQLRVASLLHGLCLAPTAQPWLLRVARGWPGAMRLAAAWTRLPGHRPHAIG